MRRVRGATLAFLSGRSRLHFEALQRVPVLVLNVSEDFSENTAKQAELMAQVSRASASPSPSAELCLPGLCQALVLCASHCISYAKTLRW